MAFSNFIPTLWSARLQEHLDKVHVYGALVNRDYEGEIKKYGDTVKINMIGDITVKNYTPGTDIDAPEDLDGSQKELKIDQAKYVNFACDDVNAAQAKPKLMDKAMERAAYAINDVTDGFLAGLMAAGATNHGATLGTDATPLVPTATTAYDMLVDLAVDLTEKNVSKAGRFCVVPAFFHGLLLKDSRFVGNGTDYNKAILEGGEVGVAAGMRIYVSNNVPNTTGTKYKIVAGTSAATTFAEQILANTMEAYRPERRFADAIKGLHVYGAKVTQGNGLSVLTVNKA